MNEIRIEGLPLAEHVKRWDEYEGNLYELSALLTGDEEKRVTFGVRDFGDNGKGRLALNGRTIFLRSEANCAEFPETGYTPVSYTHLVGFIVRHVGQLSLTQVSVSYTHLERLVERTSLTEWDTADGKTTAVLPIQNLLSKDREYLLILSLDTAEQGEVRYYTRILWTDNENVKDMIDRCV